MSCNQRAKQFFAHSSITGLGTPAAAAFGNPEAAQLALEDIFTGSLYKNGKIVR